MICFSELKSFRYFTLTNFHSNTLFLKVQECMFLVTGIHRMIFEGVHSGLWASGFLLDTWSKTVSSRKMFVCLLTCWYQLLLYSVNTFPVFPCIQLPRCSNSVASLTYNHEGQILAVASSYTYQEATEMLVFLPFLVLLSFSCCYVYCQFETTSELPSYCCHILGRCLLYCLKY